MLFFLSLIESEPDRSKFEQIYRKYRSCIYFFAYDILKNEQDAEDVTQECFLQIAQNLDKFESPESKKTLSLIVLMSKHRAIDLYRRRRRRAAVSLEENENIIPAPEEELLEVDDNLKGILGQLNPRYREILILKFCHGYPYPDIARLMQISEPAARKLLQRAREQFETLYQAQNTDPA